MNKAEMIEKLKTVNELYEGVYKERFQFIDDVISALQSGVFLEREQAKALRKVYRLQYGLPLIHGDDTRCILQASDEVDRQLAAMPTEGEKK